MMNFNSKALRALLVACGAALTLAACGGGNGNSDGYTHTTGAGSATGASAPSGASSTTGTTGTTATITASGTNVVALTVEKGPNAQAANTPFVTVTVCVSGSTTCDTINNVLVDTGSTGLRVLNTSLPVTLASLTRNTSTSSGSFVNECGQFVSGYTWGTLRTGDLKVGQETAAGITLQVIADPAAGTAPSDCVSAGSSNAVSTAQALGANGILGVQGFLQDCGSGCVTQAVPATYYGCDAAGATCTAIEVPLAQQVGNPVAAFTTDNNGVILEMPSVAATGATTATGSLVFGIGTQTNNALGSAVQIPVDGNFAFTSTYQGAAISNSFVDSGSNFLFFTDSTLPACTQSGLTPFYCPTTTTAETATLSQTSTSSATTYTADFSVANAATLLANTSNYAFNDVAANVGSGQGLGMDFGMPFFYGRNVYIGFEGASTTTTTTAGSTGTAGYVGIISNGE